MLIKRPTPHMLLIRDQPGCFWLLGLFFVGIGGLVIAGLLGLFTGLETVSAIERFASWLLALAALSAGVYIISRSPGSRTALDKRAGLMSVRRWGLMRTREERFSLDQIAAIGLAQSSDTDGDPVYRVIAHLASGAEVPLTLLWLRGHDRLEAAIAEIRAFLAPDGGQPGIK